MNRKELLMRLAAELFADEDKQTEPEQKEETSAPASQPTPPPAPQPEPATTPVVESEPEKEEVNEEKEELERLRKEAEESRLKAVRSEAKTAVTKVGVDPDTFDALSDFIDYGTLLGEEGGIDNDKLKTLVSSINAVALRTPPSKKSETKLGQSRGIGQYLNDSKKKEN